MGKEHNSDLKISEQIKRYITYLKELVQGKDLSAESMTEVLNYAKRLWQVENAKSPHQRDPLLLRILPSLESLDLANKSLASSKNLLSRSSAQEKRAIKDLEETSATYRQALAANVNISAQSGQKKFIEKYPIFNLESQNLTRQYEKIKQAQLGINNNFLLQKSRLATLLLAQSYQSIV